MRSLVFFILFQFLLQLSEAQTLHYTVRLGDEVMGKMTAVRSVSGKTLYSIESLINVQKMITVDLFYRIEAQFEKQILTRSSAIEKANGKEHTKSETRRILNGYNVITKKASKTIPHKGINYNLCTLYFHEPEGRTSVWSDTFGEMLGIKPAGEHKYELTLPNGKSSFYTYHKGICTLVESEMIFGKITFTLTK
ncbi:MAG: hypothetical protein JNL88_07045 [Bacteroidia bacterium]|nr:hypothetical protein [Bacteroidia bacterium]